ncbi:hypothetical protein TPA0909_05080 [Streptomyces albus]|nr:hypothetical protein TPA0909_05080 [Streptomyces albus]
MPAMLRVEPDGRAQRNQTFEGLTAWRGGHRLTASMEGPLRGDGTDGAGRPLVRFQNWRLPKERQPGGQALPVAQWAYPVDDGLAVAEIAAAGDGRLLVLERGYDVATKANTIRLYLADPRRAGDVRDVARLHTGQGGVRPVRKTLLADLGDCPDLGAPNPSRSRTRCWTTSRRWRSPDVPTAGWSCCWPATTTRVPNRSPGSTGWPCACRTPDARLAHPDMRPVHT